MSSAERQCLSEYHDVTETCTSCVSCQVRVCRNDGEQRFPGSHRVESSTRGISGQGIPSVRRNTLALMCNYLHMCNEQNRQDKSHGRNEAP